MKYFLTPNAVLKHLEKPYLYNIKNDELYELNKTSFQFLIDCSTKNGGYSNDNKFIEYCIKEGILNKKYTAVKRPIIKKSPIPSLRYLELQITNRCNLRCRHCFINHQNDELGLEQIKKVLTEFEKMQGLRVMITGGEPLMHSKFKEINEMLADFSFRRVLFTNGLLINKKLLNKLNIHEIQISIDGLEKAHDSIRGRGTFKKAIRSLKQAIDSGIDISVATMIHRKNLNDFDKMQKLFTRMGIKEWTVDIPCITGRLKENPDFQITPVEGSKFLSYGYSGGIHSSSKGYACGLHLMAVNANGYASKCSFYSDSPVGHINEGLQACWSRIKPIKLSTLKCDCDFIEICRGGCRFRAELSGEKSGKDPYKCAYFKKSI
jgi:radical SAM protein with 4Fe4S-binding SPASM domain